ncbi:type IV secretion system DNA-binding domain-containing protein [Nocardia sp. NPDC004604]|uniref:type IV secretory system conjugative DNA transfer family protein n=1 Tax=Nocardia sp. NPDC004604 TaxID=3157013 RepID=UPI0033A68812
MTTERPAPTPDTPGRRRLHVAALDWPGRAAPKPLGVDPAGFRIGVSVEAARHHIHVPGVTGTGKSTWLANLALAEAAAGRGLVVLDCQGDLADNVLARLPSDAAGRLVVLDPVERTAPPAWNVLAAPSGAAEDADGRERAARMVIETFRKVYAQWWGPRMDEMLCAACLTLARRPGATLAEVIPILTTPGYHRPIIDRYGEPIGFEGFWDGFTAQTPAQRQQSCGAVISRLREVLSHRFAADLFAAPAATFDLTEILDGGILIARLPKGEIGEGGVQLVGSLLLSGLWQATTGRAKIPPNKRADATIIVDECHNFLHLPIGIDQALAEARGYRVSFVLAHQNLSQLPPEIRGAVDANARNKIVFTVSPDDARKLAPHFEPIFDDTDLRHRDGYAATVRIIDQGVMVEPFSVATEALPPPVPGRAEQLRTAARVTAGLSRQRRDATGRRRKLATGKLGTGSADSGAGHGFSPPPSIARSLPRSPAHLERGSDRGTPGDASSQTGGGER